MTRIAHNFAPAQALSAETPEPKGDARKRPRGTETFERRDRQTTLPLAKAPAVPRGQRTSVLDLQLGPIEDPIPTSTHRKEKLVELRPIHGVLFDGSPDPNDVEQGDNGDCFVLAPALAAAARRPDLLERCIKQIDDRVYEVTVWIHDDKTDTWSQRTAVVDNDFYVNKETGELAYAQARTVRGKGRVLWPLILEKAMTLLVEDDAGTAPKRGSYSTINGGYEKNILKMLTGVEPSGTTFNTNPPKDTNRRNWAAVQDARIEKVAERAWQRLVKGLDAGGIAVMGTPGEAGSEMNPELNELGLCGGHVYGVIGYREVDGQRLVTLQNPWRSFEPGDTDPLAEPTPDDGEEDGRFEVPIEWVVEHFQDLSIAVPE